MYTYKILTVSRLNEQAMTSLFHLERRGIWSSWTPVRKRKLQEPILQDVTSYFSRYHLSVDKSNFKGTGNEIGLETEIKAISLTVQNGFQNNRYRKAGFSEYNTMKGYYKREVPNGSRKKWPILFNINSIFLCFGFVYKIGAISHDEFFQYVWLSSYRYTSEYKEKCVF